MLAIPPGSQVKALTNKPMERAGKHHPQGKSGDANTKNNGESRQAPPRKRREGGKHHPKRERETSTTTAREEGNAAPLHKEARQERAKEGNLRNPSRRGRHFLYVRLMSSCFSTLASSRPFRNLSRSLFSISTTTSTSVRLRQHDASAGVNILLPLRLRLPTAPAPSSPISPASHRLSLGNSVGDPKNRRITVNVTTSSSGQPWLHSVHTHSKAVPRRPADAASPLACSIATIGLVTGRHTPSNPRRRPAPSLWIA